MHSLSKKLWIYTNFDCNLKCSYCVAESSPTAPQNSLSFAIIQRLVDEAVSFGFEKVFLTGGEPFILTDIFEIIAYSSARLETTVLTNALLFKGKRLEKLCAIANDDLRIQVSLDGGAPEHHDPFRGDGTWAKTVDGIRTLIDEGFKVSISTTETPANTSHLNELHAFRRSLGILDEDHFVRPMAKRGFAQEGVHVGTNNLVPEVTVTAKGVYWHPLVSPSDTDMLVTKEIFPLANAVQCIEEHLKVSKDNSDTEREEFT
ncbi:MAG: radical SAM protein [Anaerolineales bacterium]|nr:radical SAM protein [Chloroflexota bacterium]MBL6979707.1 radical SAM protein [Anaerolineales bacterium]